MCTDSKGEFCDTACFCQFSTGFTYFTLVLTIFESNLLPSRPFKMLIFFRIICVGVYG